jgi:hypothetical protein
LLLIQKGELKMANEPTETKKTPANWRDLPAIEVKVHEKTCGKCQRNLPAKDFWKMRTSKDGLQPQCKDCQLGTPLGTNTGKGETKKAEPKPKSAPKNAKKDPDEKPAKSDEKPAPARKSRAAVIGSGRRKECGGCTYQIKSTEGGRCISADAEKDAENKAKTCPHLVQSKTSKKKAKKAKKE